MDEVDGPERVGSTICASFPSPAVRKMIGVWLIAGGSG